MQNTLLVMRQEIYKTLRSPGYVIFALIVPVSAVLILAGVKFIRGRADANAGESSSAPSQFQMEVEGYVDQSGLIRSLPDNIPAGYLLAYQSEGQALQALQTGEITAYYVIPPDLIERGKIQYVYPDTRSYLDDGQPWVMEWTLLFNLLEGDAELADQVWSPIRNVKGTSISPQAQESAFAGEDCSRPGSACDSNDLIRYMPSIMVGILYMLFMVSSSMLFNSIGVEKENRMIEVLMVSISPHQLLAGKTLGLGCAGILQTIVWLGAIYFSFNLGGATLSLPEDFTFPVGILVWSLVFFLGGYGLYASLMAGAGALVPKMKEAGIANYIAAFPLMFGYVFGLMAPLTQTADSAFLVFLSIFPLTSPVVMVMRLTDSVVPLWHLVLSFLLLFVAACYTLRAAGNMFHAQNLLSGQPFSLGRYLGELTGGLPGKAK